MCSKTHFPSEAHFLSYRLSEVVLLGPTASSEFEADARGLHARASAGIVKHSTIASSQNPEIDRTLWSFNHDSDFM